MGHCYIFEEMSDQEIEATIQEIKDLDFTLDVEEKDRYYSACHKKQTNRYLSLTYYHNDGQNPEVWIESFQ